MTTVGEPIEPEVWRWYYSEVGKGEAAITDTWWQTENGGFLGSTLPALQPMKPGSCGPGVLGIYPVIYDENGTEVPQGSGKAGNICIRNPWPGIFQTIWGDPDRFLSTYFRKYNTNPDSQDWHDWPYFTNDGAVQAADGYFRILGRVDDVINVAGHRLGTKEIESAALTVPEVAEAAAVPSGSSRTCPRPGPARSCAGSSRRPPTSPTWATSPRSPTPRSWSRSGTRCRTPSTRAARCRASSPGPKPRKSGGSAPSNPFTWWRAAVMRWPATPVPALF